MPEENNAMMAAREQLEGQQPLSVYQLEEQLTAERERANKTAELYRIQTLAWNEATDRCTELREERDNERDRRERAEAKLSIATHWIETFPTQGDPGRELGRLAILAAISAPAQQKEPEGK